MKKIAFLACMLLACGTDEITTYKYRTSNSTTTTQPAPQKAPQFEVAKPYQGDQKPVLTKTCDPPCVAPLVCNSNNGTCEGKASKKEAHSPPTTEYIDFYVLRNGRE